MIEGGKELRFALEARNAFRIGGENLGQDLQRDVAIELPIARAVDLAHAARSKRRQNLIRAERRAGHQRHGLGGHLFLIRVGPTPRAGCAFAVARPRA
jgi:hypothetical protein